MSRTFERSHYWWLCRSAKLEYLSIFYIATARVKTQSRNFPLLLNKRIPEKTNGGGNNCFTAAVWSS